MYDSICDFPMSWTQPALGRLNLPDVKYYVGSPSATGDVTSSAAYDSFGTAVPNDDLHNRHVVFVGGGLRLFDKSLNPPAKPATYTTAQWDAFLLDLLNPSFLVLDIETGHNLFKYIWPSVVAKGNDTASFNPVVWPEVDRTVTIGHTTTTVTTVPYAMDDPVAIDIWNPLTGQPSDDGFTDRVYIGDVNGLFYGIKFTSGTASVPGMQIDIWRTKPITDSDEQASNFYRGLRQPITQSPSISFETPQIGVSPNLRIIYAGGKYEDVVGATDDKTDLNKTSLYNLQDSAANPTLTSTASDVFGTGYKFQILQHCTSTSFLTGCEWTKSGGASDCCQAACTNPCYQCVFDLTQPVDPAQPAERFVAKPLIAGGLVFATSFLPSMSPCDYTGTGYLYIFDYQCKFFTVNFNPLTSDTNPTSYSFLTPGGGTGSVGSATNTGVQLSLGVGIPSRPVLSSDSKYVIVQMSDGTLKKIPVNLKTKPIQVQGWQEK